MSGISCSIVLAVAVAACFAPNASAAEAVSTERVQSALPQLRAMAQQMVDSGAAPGLAIAVVHDDEVVFLEGFGVREVDRPEAVGPDTSFQIASMSKPISATVVAALVGDRVLDWNTRMRDLDPSFALHDPYPSEQVTVRDLFNHRSGLPGTSGNDLEDIGYDREVIMHRLRLVPPSSSFRADYAYSNAGLTAAAVAAVRPTGKDWETVAQDRLFNPLGMDTASYRHSDFASRSDAAALHVRSGRGWKPGPLRNADAQAPAGGVSASARDLTSWMRLELGRGVFEGEPLIGPDALQATHAPLMARGANPVTGDPSFYGLGWVTEFGPHGERWAHAGAFSRGARSLVALYPDSQLGILVLANGFPTGAPEAIADSFADLVFEGTIATDYTTAWNAIYDSLFGPAMESAIKAFAAPPDPAAPALPNESYAGLYANDYVGQARIEPEGDGLIFIVGPDGARRFPLRHFNRDLFLYYPDAEMPDTPSALSFEIGPDGKATSLTAESLDLNGLGTLEAQ